MRNNHRTREPARPPKPDREEIVSALTALQDLPEMKQGRFLWASVVGSWADDCWQPGHDVDLRAVYALPTASYLGLSSFRDEIEIVRTFGRWEMDLVAFEVEKVARLILKGHRPTLTWLGADARAEVIWRGRGTEVLARAAQFRLAQIDQTAPTTDPGLPEDLFHSLDRLVIGARLGDLGP